jgi:hypothetical protein
VPKATSFWFAACSAGFGGAPKESTQTIHVLLVLPEQHGRSRCGGTKPKKSSSSSTTARALSPRLAACQAATS